MATTEITQGAAQVANDAAALAAKAQALAEQAAMAQQAGGAADMLAMFMTCSCWRASSATTWSGASRRRCTRR